MGRAIGVATATLTSSLALAVVVPASAPVLAASITVTTTVDGIDAAPNCQSVTLGSLPGPGGQTTLREAICAANKNPGSDTITFSVNGTFTLTGAANEDNGNSGDLDVSGSTQINGNGAANTIIDGGGIERIFDVFPAVATTFSLSSLTVQHGDTRSTSFKEGGAIYLHNNVTTTLTSVVVKDNFAGANGAIENRGTLTMTGSVISGNLTAPASGSMTGGGMHNTGTLTITDSTFANNTVRGEGGGLATATGPGVTVSITGTTFSANGAQVTGGGSGLGGAISTSGNQGTLNLTNVTISGNGADNDGGGISFSTPGGGTGSGTFNNVTITNNTADTNDNANGAGGGIARAGGSLVLRNTIVAGNFNSNSAVRDDINGTIAGSSSYNLVGVNTGLAGITNGTNNNVIGTNGSPANALLSGLASNGGPTQTHALQVGSPAINTGNNLTCAGTDQRGVARAGTCDKGSYELNDTTPPDTTITTNPANPSASTTATFTFTGSDTGGSGLASFQCKLDAAANFTACTSPQTYNSLASGSHTFQVRAVDGSGNTDPTPASYTWVIDTTAPNTTITANPTNPTSSVTASFSFTGSDPGGSGVASFQCQLDGGGYVACTSPKTYGGLSDGSHTFQVRAIDAAGNTDPTPASSTWVIDTTGPNTTITANPTNPTNSVNASFSFTGSDLGGSGVISFQCQLDGGGFTVCTSPKTYGGLADGSHTFQVRAMDAAGNIDLTPAAFTWVIDTNGPDTTITANPANPTNSANASFSFTGSDIGGSGVASFQCQLDGGGFTVCTSPQTYAGLADGSHTFQVRAVDAAGNIDVTPAAFTWVIDTTGPDTSLLTHPTDPTASTNPSFTFNGSDPGGTGVASFQCQLDAGGYVPCSSPTTYVGLTDGPHTFEVRAVDAAGNVDATPVAFSWTVDTGAPATAITGNPTDPSATGDATFSFTGDDLGGTGVAFFECQLDAGGYTPCTSPIAYLALADGSHTFQVRAVDTAGNTDPTPATYTWVVDTTGPDTSITGTPADPSNSGGASFTFIGDDGSGSGVASFECQLDGGSYTACASPQAYVGLADGSHTFQVRAIDVAGNVDPTPASFTWVVDTTGPDTTITATPTDPSGSAGASFSFTGNDPGGSGVASFECRLDGGAFAPCTSPQAYVGLADGSHTFQVRAIDNAANVDPTPAAYTWVVDTTGPDTSITANPANPSGSANASFSFTGNDGSGSGIGSFECRLDGGGFSACTSPQAYVGLADGSHTFEVRAIDVAGNVDPTPASFTWVVDTTGPDTTITANPTDPSNSANATFSFSGSDVGGSGVTSFECQVDGSGFAPCTTPQTYTGLADGSHTFQVRAVDAAANVDPTPAAYSWVVDTTGPDTTITANPTDPSNSAAASFSFSGSDLGGTGVTSFECRLDGAAFAPCTSPQAYAGLADGPHTFEVRAVDAAGNVDPTPAAYGWTIDTGAPSTTLTAFPTNPTASTSASFSFTGADGTGTGVASFECQLDGGGFAACTSPQAHAGLADGSHTFEVRAIDGVGTADPTPATYTWLVDTTGPDTTITATPADPSSSATAAFSFTGADGSGSGVASFTCSIDGGAFLACTSPQTYTGLADGSHTFRVRAIDAAGNTDPTPASSTWTIDTVVPDTTAPDTTLTTTPPNPSGSSSASFAFTGTDNAGGSGVASFECRLDGAAFTSCTSPQTYNDLAAGTHTFQVRALDALANADATPASVTWTVVEVASGGPTTTVAAASSGGGLPTTGSNSWAWLQYAVVVLGCGVLLLGLRGRRRSA